jgi:hypothetical protein
VQTLQKGWGAGWSPRFAWDHRGARSPASPLLLGHPERRKYLLGSRSDEIIISWVCRQSRRGCAASRSVGNGSLPMNA